MPAHGSTPIPSACPLTRSYNHAAFVYPKPELDPRYSSSAYSLTSLAPTHTHTTTAMLASSSSKLAGKFITTMALLQYLLVLVSLACLVRNYQASFVVFVFYSKHNHTLSSIVAAFGKSLYP